MGSHSIWLVSVLAMLSAAAGANSGGASECEVLLDLSPAPLYGTMILPEGEGQVPGVLILPGSGPVDRNGNFPGGRNDSLKLLARGLAERGIASLRIDKRGIGSSREAAPDEAALRVTTYAEDATHWLDRFRAEPRISRFFILGHSEGALIGMLAAKRSPIAGLVLLAAPGERLGVVIRRQLAAAGLTEPLRDQADAALIALEAGQLVASPPPELAALLRPSVQPYLASLLAVDPSAELASLNVPALVVQGGHDLQIDEADTRHLVAARLDVKLALIPGMNHVLKLTPADRARNLAAYNDPSLPLAPGLLDAVVAFVAP